MKKIAIVVVSLFLVSFSCRQSCSPAAAMIGFVHLSNQDTDTIIVRRFQKSNSFSHLVDSFEVNNQRNQYTVRNDSVFVLAAYGLDLGITSAYDWEVYLPSIGKTWRITDIIENQQYYSNSFSCEKSACQNRLESFKANGTKYNVSHTDLEVVYLAP